MEEKLDAWLKTYRTEQTISPVDWEAIPDQCKARLDNYARDQAVRRADRFSDEGLLDLRCQEAVRALVDAMARCWRLPGDQVRQVVEDFYDELPPRPGHEFEKLATRLFRRQVNASAGDVFNAFDPDEEQTVIARAFKYLDVPPNQLLDRTGFLAAFHAAYDTWTMKQPKDAVEELLAAAGVEGGKVSLAELFPYIEKRGGRTWAKALVLEQDIGVETAGADELVRILKRYALLVRRSGPEAIGLAQPSPVPAAESSAHDEPSGEEKPEPDPEAGVSEPDEAVERTAEQPAVETAAEDTEQELEPEVERAGERGEEDEATAEAKPVSDLDAEDREAVTFLFGEDETREQRETAGAEDEPAEGAGIAEAAEPEEEAEAPAEEESAAPERESATEVGWGPGSIRPRHDRFAPLRSGELRDTVIREIYGGNETLFDVFLAKLSGAPDWDAAKRFYAEEMLEREVNLEDPPSKDLFFTLKQCLAEEDE